MLISGLQKLTLLDYPGKVACTVFTGGCNFRCPFCHNSALVLPEKLAQDSSADEVLRFLRKRVGVLDGVAVTGGEPLLHPDMGDFLREVKALGFPVKLDTNGSSRWFRPALWTGWPWTSKTPLPCTRRPRGWSALTLRA